MTATILERRWAIDNARTDKMRELMAEYDRNVHQPALDALISECKASGHKQGNIHNNGLGWTFLHCRLCGAVMEKHGPEGQVIIP